MNKVYKGEQTREKILMAAVELFGEKGFDQVSLQMIGDRVGISQAAVAQHFGNKRNIIFRVRELVTKSNQTFVDSSIQAFDKPAKQLIDYAIANLRWGVKNRQLAQIIVLTYYFSMMDPEFQQAQKRSVQIAVERVERYVISCHREDKFIKKNQTFAIASAIHQYVFGVFVRELAVGLNRQSLKAIEKDLTDTIPVLLRAR